eukprot:6050881-Pleurochrysis_carterae.AAC.5
MAYRTMAMQASLNLGSGSDAFDCATPARRPPSATYRCLQVRTPVSSRHACRAWCGGGRRRRESAPCSAPPGSHGRTHTRIKVSSSRETLQAAAAAAPSSPDSSPAGEPARVGSLQELPS